MKKKISKLKTCSHALAQCARCEVKHVFRARGHGKPRRGSCEGRVMQHHRLQLARFSQDSLQDASLRHTSQPSQAEPKQAATMETGAASRSSLEPGDLARACSGFGLGVAATFRLIAQLRRGPCCSRSSATHLPVPAHPLSRPQCHSRFPYMSPESQCAPNPNLQTFRPPAPSQHPAPRQPT